MKPLVLLFAFANLVVTSHANPILMRPRPAIMAGETVAVKLQKEVADVEAVYEFHLGAKPVPRVVYFPLFASAKETPAAVLARCSLELELDGQPVGPPSPCEPPLHVDGLPAGVRVCWFAADVDSLSGDDSKSTGRLVLRARFRQPKIGGRFYYVPLVSGVDFSDRLKRAWNYQLHARTTTRMPRVSSPASDYETFGDTVTVYLRNGEIVVLE